MEKNKIKAVYFDMGGVLMGVSSDYNRENAIEAAFSNPEVRAYLGNKFDINAFALFMDECIENRKTTQPGIQEDAWRVDKEMLEKFTGKTVPVNVLKLKFWNQIKYMTSCFYPVEGIQDTLGWLKNEGFIIGLISNVFHPAIVFKELFTQWEIIDYFNPLIFSSDYRFKKPHPEIFKYALSWHPQLTAESVIFVGDTWDIDVKGALSVGMKPVWISPESNETEKDGVSVLRCATELPTILK